MDKNTTEELRMEFIRKIDDIGFAINQSASVALSVHEALHSTGEGEDYAPALHLVSNVLKEQESKLFKLMDVVLKAGGNDEK